MKNLILKSLSFLVLVTFMLNACKSEEEDTVVNNDDLPYVYSKFNSTISISKDGDFVVIKSDGVPDHKSPYFENGNVNYEAYNGNNSSWRQNPNSIGTNSYVFRIPCEPSEKSVKDATGLGPIGVSLNGVPLYNQYAGPNNQPLTDEINSFDQYNGHPDGQSRYHYHIEPLSMTKSIGKNALLGILLDGFPVYGPEEDGKTVLNENLDDYHGHFGTTAEFPDGIYHYHFTDNAPYLNGNGYFGTKGTVTN